MLQKNFFYFVIMDTLTNGKGSQQLVEDSRRATGIADEVRDVTGEGFGEHSGGAGLSGADAHPRVNEGR